MTLQRLAWLALPLAAALAACSSSEKQIANGLIAKVLSDVDGAEVDESQKAVFTNVVDGEEVTVRWNKGPLRNTDRTFVLDDVEGPIFAYTYESDSEEGYLVAVASEHAMFAIGGVQPNDSDTGALGAAHFGEEPKGIPTAGTMTYGGAAAGLIVNTGPQNDQLDAFVGETEILANFGTGAVNGTFSDLIAETNGSLDDITFAGTMSTGNTNYSASSIAWGIAPTDGTLIGGFYGPGAISTAGAFDISRGGGTPLRAVGGYVANAVP